MLRDVDARGLTASLVGLTLIVIAIGGLIRIYDAGEACPDWPTCFGTWGFEISEQEQQEWYEENPNQIDSRGSSHRYSAFQIFTEWFHRLLAGVVLGPLVLFNLWLCRQDEGLGPETGMATMISVILIIWQGAVGWLTVELDNENWSVVLHLGSALAFTMSLIWVWLSASKDKGKLPAWFCFDSELANEWKSGTGLLALGAILAIFSGTFVSTTNGANSGCGISGFPGSWPLCEDRLVSTLNDIIAQSQMIHRWLVVIVGLSLLWASYSLWKGGVDVENGVILRNWIWVATGVFMANAAIGATYVLSWNMNDGYFEFLSLLHLILGSLAFLALATAWLGSVMVNRGRLS
ncbi:MAG: COX15/CtaA family protein [Candidatus Thalassarchaeaceae archaeon]|nr:COX15/CtaA family protein [Candidatus Thalassarchaeaceae archaeon]